MTHVQDRQQKNDGLVESSRVPSGGDESYTASWCIGRQNRNRKSG